MIRSLRDFLLLMLVTGVASAGLGLNGPDDDIPPAERAFDVTVEPLVGAQAVRVDFILWPNVYLYQHRLAFRLQDRNGNLLSDFADWRPPAGKPKHDEIFGDVEVYYDGVVFELPLDSVPLVPAELEVSYQGCLEDVLCYPPVTERFQVNFVPAAGGPDAGASTGDAAAGSANAASTSAGDVGDDFFAVLASQDANVFSGWMSSHGLGMIAVLFFAGGLLLAFTPCVFPMIPILSGIIAGAGNPGPGRGFSLSLSYVLGMAVPYTLAGLLVAVFGAGLNLQYMLQQPAAIIVSAAVFAVLSLAMFGVFEMQLPAFLRDRLGQASAGGGGSLPGAAVMGAIAALVVSPCVTPILAGALVYVAASGDAATGALSLFCLAMGMGTPLVLAGTGGASLLPRAGAWMDDIRRFFGVVMLGIAIWLLDRILADSVTMALYGLLLAGYGVKLGALDPVVSDVSRIKRTLALVLTLYGAVMVVGAASGGTDPLNPLAKPDTAPAAAPESTGETFSLTPGSWQTVHGQGALEQALGQAREAGAPVLVDFFAEWCVACRVLEEETLTHPDVLAAMSEYALIRADITEINDENRQIMQKYEIIGLPALVFFDQRGEEVTGKRILGEMGPEKFLRHLGSL